MKKMILILALIFGTHLLAVSWGFWAHKTINRLAVFTLPPAMIGFYKKHIEFITENAVNPDKRRHAVEGEAPRHYIDIDHYGKYPFEEVPRRWEDAVEKFTEDTLQAYGIVPWHVNLMMYQLTEAFKAKDPERILRLSADMGHYIADAHVPLHTTKNYNGQLTGQKGIHAFWESRLPELFHEQYDYFVGKAEYIENPLDEIWEAVLESAAAVDSVLLFEKELSKEMNPDQKYVYEKRGESTIKTYSVPYSKAYHDKLNGMVERRLRASVHRIGSFWFTAWVNAGQPDINALTEKLTKEELKKLKEEEQLYKEGKIKTRPHEH